MNRPDDAPQPPSEPSLAHLAATTPARDWTRGKLTGSLDWKRVIARADLPEPLAELVTEVVGRSRLWRSERVDLAGELCAHFADGLQAGTETQPGSDSRAAVEQLVHNFGDPKKASVLIRRAKKRGRHWTYRAFVHAAQGLGAILIAGFFLYAVLAWRFYAGEPTIARNFAAEYNETINSIPESDRAYDLYIEASIALEPPPESLLKAWPNIAPEHPAYQDATAYLERSARALSLIHEAAARPRLGATLSNATDPRITEMLRERHPQHTEQSQEPEENPAMVTIVLPQLGQMRAMYRLLEFDAHTAARHRQSEQVVQDITTMLGLAEHAAEGPALISSLVGLAISTGAIWTTSQIIHEYPDLFTDEQLRELAHRHAAFMDGVPRVDLSGERWFFEDAVQRVYTDDGHGNGYITAEGLRHLLSLQNPAADLAEQFGPQPLAPLSTALIANRADMTAKYDQLMTTIERNAELPMWEYDSHDRPNTEVNLLSADPILRTRYFPIVMLMPAFESALQTAEKVVQHRDGLLVGIALELYRREHGTYPDTLDALVPVFLPAVPPDRFTGTPLNYALVDSEPRLWSVGADRNDDGGVIPASNRADVHRWVPKDQARLNEQSDPDRYDGDWLLWPILYEPITGEDEE
ncbi:MAG: hypothetical protein Q9O74_10225 [Planctomycetota bacterium]|nr:hypothetical protein [Planctomycetota bacterium]